MQVLEKILEEIERESYSTNTNYGHSVVVNMDSVVKIIRSHVEDVPDINVGNTTENGGRRGEKTMKYKIGDKFLVEIEVAKIDENNVAPYKMLPYGFGGWNDAALDALRRPDDMTADEAWEIARRILCEYFEDENEEYSKNYTSSLDLLMKLSPQQAKAKIEAREAMEEVKVGDAVEFLDITNDLRREMFVTSKLNNGDFCGICKNGDTYCVHRLALKKTGQHIDIQSILEQIGGRNENV